MWTLLIKMADSLTGTMRVTVAENERVIALARGRFLGLYGPGEHRLPRARGTLVLERHDLNRPQLTSAYERALIAARPDLAEAHFLVLAAEEGNVAALFRDGALVALSLSPRQRTVWWRAAGPWAVRRYPLGPHGAVPEEMVQALRDGGFATQISKATVEAGQVGLLHVGGAFAGVLEPGVHLFWNAGQGVSVRLVDLRWRSHEVTGQEVLTADRVTIRVNISAAYRVTDPVRAASAVKDFAEALHRALQLAFRKSVGTRSLDRMLEEKVSVDAEAADAVRAEMAEIGLEVGEIALKDVVLPGEMREILNRVVAAEKEAEANVIKRREETAATRALLNTAKVLAENPVMLRLKELEALTEIAGKVERLTVTNGTEGLMSDLVRLTDRR